MRFNSLYFIRLITKLQERASLCRSKRVYAGERGSSEGTAGSWGTGTTWGEAVCEHAMCAAPKGSLQVPGSVHSVGSKERSEVRLHLRVCMKIKRRCLELLSRLFA